MTVIDKDLWGDFTLEDIELEPLNLLNHQASLLKEKTFDFMRGEVISRTFSTGESQKERIFHLFNVVVPGLKNRRVELFRAVHDVNSVFPIDMQMNNEPRLTAKAVNFDEFKQLLSNFLTDPYVKLKIHELFLELRVKGVAKPI